MERSSRSISDKLKRAERTFLRGLEALVSPALSLTDQRWKDVEYEVLSDACSRYEVELYFTLLVLAIVAFYYFSLTYNRAKKCHKK